MVKIYLVRHCESEGNIKRLFQGYTDMPISELGAKQLGCLKARFKNIHIDKAYSSPLSRALKTAEAAVSDKNIEIIKDESFIEICCGDVDGKPFDEIFKDEYMRYTWYDAPHLFAPPKGETMGEVYERMKAGLMRLASDAENEGKALLVASHGAAIRCALCYLMFDNIEKLAYTPWSSNTAVSLISFENGKATIEFANDVSHLPEEYLRKKPSIMAMKKEEK